MLGLQSPLHLFGDGLWQPEFLHGLFQGLQVALRPRLLSLEPLTLLVQAVLPGFLQSLVISCGLGHGSLLRFVAVPRSWHGGDHDPFFMGYQALSHGLDDSAASVAASDKKRTSQAVAMQGSSSRYGSFDADSIRSRCIARLLAVVCPPSGWGVALLIPTFVTNVMSWCRNRS